MITDVETLRAIGTETLPHPIEHILRLVVERFPRGRAANQRRIQTDERGSEEKKRFADSGHTLIKSIGPQKQPPCPPKILFLDSTQQHGRPDKGDHDAREKDEQIRRIKLQAGVIHIHPAKGPTEVCQRKNLGDVTDVSRQLF